MQQRADARGISEGLVLHEAEFWCVLQMHLPSQPTGQM
jgi:hypothetical protein